MGAGRGSSQFRSACVPLAALLLQSCASAPGPAEAPVPPVETSSTATAAPLSAMETLMGLAKAEAHSPAAFDPDTPPPAGIDAAGLSPLPSDQVAKSTKLGRPLDATINELEGSWKPPVPEQTGAGDPDPEDQADALSKFAQARLLILDHDPAQAIPLLQAAARLDPGSSRLWRELGQAHLDLNRRAAGIAALKRALSLGDTDASLCYVLGRDAARAAKTDEALPLLIHALTSLDENDDPALSYLIMADLARALLADGRIRAARDAMVASAELPETWTTDSDHQTELAELYRARFDQWMGVGDLSCRLGDHDLAREAYDRASRTPALDPGLVLPRQVFATLRAGRPAEASLLVLGAIDRADGRFEDRHAELIRYLSTRTSLGPSIAAALGEISANLKERATPSTLAHLARVEAGALPPEGARQTLLRAALAAPSDLDAVAALVDSYPVDQIPSLAASLATLAQSAPDHAWTTADALLLTGRNVEEALAALRALPEPAPRLVEAAILARTGRMAQAATRLDDVRSTLLVPELKAAWLAMRTDVAAALADSATVDACVEALKALATPESSVSIQLAHAAALRSARLFPEAASTATAACSAGDGVYGCLLAADAALRAGDASAAEQALLKALDTDKCNESVYEALFALYGTSNEPGASDKLGEMARQLRNAVPSGRLLRVLTARDMVAHGQVKDAEPILTELARRNPPDSRAVELLAGLATRAFKTDAATANRVEAFLRALLASRPDSPYVLAASARATAAIGKGQAAADLIATRLSYWPMPDLARARESIVRDVLNEPALATKLAKDRLGAAPRTFANAAELAELLTREDDLAGAARVLSDALSAGARLSLDQARTILKLLGQLPPTPADEASGKGALLLFDQMEAQKVPLTSPLLVKRIHYAAHTFADDPAKVFGVADAAAKSSPDIGDAAFDIVFKTYADEKRFDRFLHFSEQVATSANPWKSVYAQHWLGAIANWGNAEDARRLLESIAAPDRLKEFSKLLDGDPVVVDAKAEEKHDVRARIAYELGGLMLRGDRPGEAIQTYLLALEIEPNYHIVENDLGYLLLDRGESLDEAARLIEAAFSALPENANVVDSIGWLRYKQGRLADQLGETGLVESEGAITLLERAVRLAENDGTSDAVNEHYGDALWRGGKPTEALRVWRSAAEERASLVDLFSANQEVSSRAKEMKESLAILRTKIDAAAAGGQPPVAAIWPAKGVATEPAPQTPPPQPK